MNPVKTAEREALPTDHPLTPAIAKAFQERRSQFEHPANVLFIHTEDGRDLCISVTPPWPLAAIQREDGTWRGDHCITSTTFCTAASLITLAVAPESARVTAPPSEESPAHR